MLSSDIKTTLFGTAATISFVSAVHHIHKGFAELYKPWQALQPAPRRAALTGWDYMNVTYGLLILLNWRWARIGGPSTTEEKEMLAVIITGGLFEARRSITNGEYIPLVAFLGIPGLSLLATLL